MNNDIRPLCCDICARQIEGDMIKLNINRYIRTMDFRPVKERTLCADCWDAVVSCIEDLIDERRSIQKVTDKLDKTDDHTCGNCTHLILKNYKSETGTCFYTHRIKSFWDRCDHEEEMS